MRRIFCALLLGAAGAAAAQEQPMGGTAPGGPAGGMPETADVRRSLLPDPGGRLLLTGGVSTIEGAGGGGLVPWALIGGYGTRDEFGVTAFGTGVDTQDFSLAAYGAAVNWRNRLELSLARQHFNLRQVGTALGLPANTAIRQTIIGAKLRLAGDAVLEQDRWLPQIAVGVQHKINEEEAIIGGALGLDRTGTDVYLAATKLFLAQSLLVNGTVRLTRANQFGILGFGEPGRDGGGWRPQFETSVAYLVTRKIAVGGEYRMKPNRLEGAVFGGTAFREEDAWDLFVAVAPLRNVSFTLAYARLGQIAVARQDGVYGSIQVGF